MLFSASNSSSSVSLDAYIASQNVVLVHLISSCHHYPFQLQPERTQDPYFLFQLGFSQASLGALNLRISAPSWQLPVSSMRRTRLLISFYFRFLNLQTLYLLSCFLPKVGVSGSPLRPASCLFRIACCVFRLASHLLDLGLLT